VKILVCRECGNKNKFRGKKATKEKLLCKDCGARLDLQDRSPQQTDTKTKISGKKILYGIFFLLFSALSFWIVLTTSFLEAYLLPGIIVSSLIGLIGILLIATCKQEVEKERAAQSKGVGMGKSIVLLLVVLGLFVVIKVVFDFLGI
jgi:hypothetical protein